MFWHWLNINTKDSSGASLCFASEDVVTGRLWGHRKQKTVSGQEATGVKDLQTKQPAELAQSSASVKAHRGRIPQY